MQAKELAGASVQAPLWVLVLVTLSGTMAMHIFVPALPVAGEALGAEPSGMQQTITLYVIGLALGQLIYGPVSDTWGRRPALLVGLSLYFSASVLALFAPSLQWLVAARLLQALGGAAGITLGRAIVRDIAPPDRVTRDLALLNLLTLVGPGLSHCGRLSGRSFWLAGHLCVSGLHRQRHAVLCLEAPARDEPQPPPAGHHAHCTGLRQPAGQSALCGLHARRRMFEHGALSLSGDCAVHRA